MAQRKPHRKRKRAATPAKQAIAEIAAIGARGDGVCDIEGASVYVPYTAPGDTVKIAYQGERGKVLELLEASAHRRDAPCPLFGECGGCALQHVEPEFYRAWKRELVVGALSRAGFDERLVAPLRSCASASRRRARFAVQRTKDGVAFGFNERQSSRIVNVRSCLVLDPTLDEKIGALRALAEAAPKAWRKFDLSVMLCDNGLDVAFIGGDAREDVAGQALAALAGAARKAGVLRLSVDQDVIVVFDAPTVSFGGVPVAVPPAGFLQASREGETVLIELVLEGIENARRIADLFSGCGTFSLPAAARAAVDACDADEAAIAALDLASRKGSLRHPVNAQARNLFARPLTAEELKPYDAVIFDPPRAGAKAQAEELGRSEVPVVIGVSCNPATFARDAAILREGGYALSQVTPVDQFVYSPHVELVGIFTKG